MWLVLAAIAAAYGGYRWAKREGSRPLLKSGPGLVEGLLDKAIAQSQTPNFGNRPYLIYAPTGMFITAFAGRTSAEEWTKRNAVDGKWYYLVDLEQEMVTEEGKKR